MRFLKGFFLFFIFCISLDSFGFDKIKFSVVAINDVNATQIKNAEIVVSSGSTSKILTLTTDKKGSYYVADDGDDIKVKVNSVGFYAEEKTIKAGSVFDGDVLEIRLSPKPSGSLYITVIDNETKDPVISEVTISFFAKNHKESINEKNPFINYFYELKGGYKLSTKADGYLNDERVLELDITTNQKETKVVIELTKNRMKQELYFFDKSTNNAIPIGDVKITHKNTGQNVYGGKLINGKVTFDANRNEDYSFEISAEGFAKNSGNFKLDGNLLKFGLVPLTSIEIDIFDEDNDKRLACDIEIISPETKKTIRLKSSDKESLKFIPSETGVYSISTKAIGYINKSGTLIVKSFSGGSSFYTLRLKRGSNEYVISVFDIITKEPINKPLIKVFNNNSLEIAGKIDKNKKTLNLETDKKHFFEVSADGYADYTANIDFDKNIQVFLKRKEVIATTNYEILLSNKITKEVVSKAIVRVFDSQEKPILVNYNSKKQAFEVNELVNTLDYKGQVAAEGFETQTFNFIKDNKTVKIELLPLGMSIVKFSVVDAYTKKGISSAAIDIILNGKSVLADNKRAEVSPEIIDGYNYKLKVIAEGYSDVERDFTKRMSKGGEYVIGIVKNRYKMSFVVVNELEPGKINDARILLQNTKTKNASTVTFANKNFEAEIDVNEKYMLDIDLEGFEHYNFSFSLNKNVENNLETLVNLKPKKMAETMVTVEKETPKVVNVVVEKEAPKEEKIVAEKEIPKPVIKEERIVKSAAVDLPENFSGIAMLQVYRANGITFEQSKPKTTPESEAMLSQLLKFMQNSEEVSIRIIGHTDDEGHDQRLNDRLSLFRAKLISNYLFNGGINPSRIEVEGKGSSEPLATNDTEENKAKNRRVEIEFFK